MKETLTCKAGHTWERTRTRGKKPQYCPDHLYLKFGNEPSPNKVDQATGVPIPQEHVVPRIATRAKETISEEQLAAMAAGRERKAREVREKELAEIDGRIEHAETSYREAFQAALRAPFAEMDHAWNVADRKQSGLMNLLAHKRRLLAKISS